MKVLVVDDNAAARDILVATLDVEGYTVFTAADGEECLRCAERELPDVILLDVMMPDESGYEVCSRLRAMPRIRETSVIMVTALTDRESRLAGFRAGADDFLTKPVDRLELKLRLRTQAQLSRFRGLLEQRSHYEELSQLSPDAIMSIDYEGHVHFQNPAAVALLGSLAGRPFAALFPPDWHADLSHAWREVQLAQRRGLRMDATLYGSQGAFPATISLGAVDVGPSGTLAIAVIRDLSERDALRSRLQRSQRLESIARVTSGIAHDFADSLLAIRGAIAQSLQRLDASHPARNPLVEASALIDDTTGLVRRVNQIGMPFVQASIAIDLVEELQAFEPFLRHLADGAPLTVEVPSTSAWILMDPTEFRQILTNLISNARDAILDRGGITVRLAPERREHTTAPGGLWWHLAVTDTGQGMPPDVLARVFDPYFTTKGESGTGIGLTTVQDIVHRHGGTISATSTEQQGTTFSVGFPAALVSTMTSRSQARV